LLGVPLVVLVEAPLDGDRRAVHDKDFGVAGPG